MPRPHDRGRVEIPSPHQVDNTNATNMVERWFRDLTYSPRADDWLRVVNVALEPLPGSSGVTDFRERLTITAV